MNDSGLKCLNPWDTQSARIYEIGGVYHAICASAKNSGLIRDGIVYAVCMDGKSKGDCSADRAFALTVPDKQSKVSVLCYDARGNGEGGWFPPSQETTRTGSRTTPPSLCSGSDRNNRGEQS